MKTKLVECKTPGESAILEEEPFSLAVVRDKKCKTSPAMDPFEESRGRRGLPYTVNGETPLSYAPI